MYNVELPMASEVLEHIKPEWDKDSDDVFTLRMAESVRKIQDEPGFKFIFHLAAIQYRKALHDLTSAYGSNMLTDDNLKGQIWAFGAFIDTPAAIIDRAEQIVADNKNLTTGGGR